MFFVFFYLSVDGLVDLPERRVSVDSFLIS